MSTIMRADDSAKMLLSICGLRDAQYLRLKILAAMLPNI